MAADAAWFLVNDTAHSRGAFLALDLQARHGTGGTCNSRKKCGSLHLLLGRMRPKRGARAAHPAPALPVGRQKCWDGPGREVLSINYLNKLSENKLESENSSQKLYGE